MPTVELTNHQRARIRETLQAQLVAAPRIADQETACARAELSRLDNEERKLVQAHYTDAISGHFFRGCRCWLGETSCR